MSRINKRFTELKEQGKTALIPYLTAGDPHPDMTVNLMHALVADGADILELGVPFSDPMADGPVIQKAVERALEYNVSLDNVLAMVEEFRNKDQKTPVVLMGYLNPIEAMGAQVFADAAKQVGVDAVLTVDMPPEESGGYLEVMQKADLDRIYLVSPTTPDTRLQAVNNQGSGFVYYVSLKGVTGSAALDTEEVTRQVKHLKTLLDLPMGIGFGIRNGDTAYQMAKVGDAIIVGSALVSLIEQNASATEEVIRDAISEKMCEFRQGIDQADAEKV